MSRALALARQLADTHNLPDGDLLYLLEHRDPEAADGTMVRDYRACYPRMIGLDTIRPLRRLVYTLFYLCPSAAAAAARVHPLRR